MSEFIGDLISEQVGEMLERDGGKLPTVTATVEFIVEPSHLAAYASQHGKLATTQKSDQKDLNVLRARHHLVARYLAAGLGEGLIAELTDFSPGHISVLKNNPAMIQLVDHYRAPGRQAVEQAQEKLLMAANGALARLVQKLEDGQLSAQEELALAKLGFDRGGAGPTSKVVNEQTTTIVDAAEVMRLAAEARKKDAERTIDVEAIRRVLPAPEQADDAAAA